jgi:hypothetical protein
MGDPTSRPGGVDRTSLDKWKTVLNNPVRAAWCGRYLRYLGPDRLKAIGYDQPAIERELHALKMTPDRLGPDLVKIVYGYFHTFFNLSALRVKAAAVRNRQRIYPFS